MTAVSPWRGSKERLLSGCGVESPTSARLPRLCLGRRWSGWEPTTLATIRPPRPIHHERHSASAFWTSASRLRLMPADASPIATAWILNPSLRWNSAPCRPSVTATMSSRLNRYVASGLTITTTSSRSSTRGRRSTSHQISDTAAMIPVATAARTARASVGPTDQASQAPTPDSTTSVHNAPAQTIRLGSTRHTMTASPLCSLTDSLCRRALSRGRLGTVEGCAAERPPEGEWTLFARALSVPPVSTSDRVPAASPTRRRPTGSSGEQRFSARRRAVQ